MVSTMFDQRSSLPKYVILANYLREQIESGNIPPGGALPSESDLMALSEYGRGVVRKAVSILQHEGLVVTDQGRRTRVREPGGEREPLLLDPSAEAIARMPTERERLRYDMDFGVPIIEVHFDGETEMHSAEGRVIRYRPPQPDAQA